MPQRLGWCDGPLSEPGTEAHLRRCGASVTVEMNFNPKAVGVAEESQLIERARAGDRAAFTQLVEVNQDRLFASMLQVTGSVDEAEEVVQEAFIRAFIKLDTFQHNSQFFTWLYRIAFNSALTRRRHKRARISLDHSRETVGLEVIDDSASVDERLLSQERVDMVRQGMQELTVEHRTILVLREMDEHSYENIAEMLDISIGTVRSRLSRARRQLRLTLEAIQAARESPLRSQPNELGSSHDGSASAPPQQRNA